MDNIIKDTPIQANSRQELMAAAMERLGKMDEEIKAGYELLKKYDRTVTFFGSARTSEDDPNYHMATELSRRLAVLGYAIISGGGFGIMSASNKGARIAVQQGARKAGGDSIAFNIKLPKEQTLNAYATASYEFQHFAPRKIVMTMFADAYIYFPGGFGTLDELMEIMTLIETGKIHKAPVILFDSSYWNGLDKFIKDQLLGRHMISPEDTEIYTITDSIDEVIKIIQSDSPSYL